MVEYGPCHSVEDSTCLHKVQFIILNKIEQKTLRLGPDETIAINGQQIVSPFAGKDFKIYGNVEIGLAVEISHFNIKLMWKNSQGLSIHVTGSNSLATLGLCGNANGEANDDYTMRNQLRTIDQSDFVHSWLHKGSYFGQLNLHNSDACFILSLLLYTIAPISQEIR